MVGDFIAGALVVTVIYVLVRPRSRAAEAVNMISNAFIAIVKAATNL